MSEEHKNVKAIWTRMREIELEVGELKKPLMPFKDKYMTPFRLMCQIELIASHATKFLWLKEDVRSVGKGATFNHALTLAFEIKGSKDEEGEDISPSQLRLAILLRLYNLTDSELLEAVGSPYDTFEEE